MKDYIDLALNTEPSEEQYLEIIKRINLDTIRLLHSFMGLATEVGEILDALKRHIFYGKDLDLVNVSEEFGDLDWYKAIGVDALAIALNQDANDLENQIKERNIAKLAARYPSKFSEYHATNRNLNLEREILENGKVS